MRSCRGGIGGVPELCSVVDCPNPVARWVRIRPDLEAGYCYDHDDTDTAESDEVAADTLEADHSAAAAELELAAWLNPAPRRRRRRLWPTDPGPTPEPAA